MKAKTTSKTVKKLSPKKAKVNYDKFRWSEGDIQIKK